MNKGGVCASPSKTVIIIIVINFSRILIIITIGCVMDRYQCVPIWILMIGNIQQSKKKWMLMCNGS